MEEKSLSIRPTGELSTIIVTSEQKALVKSVIFPDATDDELSLFVFQCQRKGVHPLDKFIYPVKRRSGTDGTTKLTFQASIDYMRSEADGSGEYDGQDEPEFEWDKTGSDSWPSLARVKIYRKGLSRPFVGIARWDEYYPGEKSGHMWRKMPCNQLAKCAEANGLRKAFPKLLGALVCPEEMQQAESDPKEKAITRSASVKSAQSEKIIEGEQEPTGEEATKNPLDEEITETLAALTNGVYEDMETMLRKASHYTDTATKKDFEFGLERLVATSAKWKTKALQKLRKWKGEADALKAEMGQDNAGGAE